MRLDGANGAYHTLQFGANGAVTTFRNLHVKCIFLKIATILTANFSIPSILNSLDHIS